MTLGHVKKVTFENQGEKITGYLSVPLGGGPHAAVVVIPAIAGINDYIKDIARRLALEGFAGLVVDTFSREGQAPDVSTPVKVTEALANLPDQRVVSDVIAAVEFLQSRNDVREDSIGVLGFCVGGTHAYLTACETNKMKAAVDFYGLIKYKQTSENKPYSPIECVSDLKAPLLGHFGENDRFISREDVDDFKVSLQENQKIHEIFTYSGAPHAFHEDFKFNVYRPIASHLAWEHSLIFLHWYLEGKLPYKINL